MIWTAPRLKLCFTYPKAIKCECVCVCVCVCYFDGKSGCFCNLGLQFWPYSFAISPWGWREKIWKERRVGGQKDIVMWNVLIKDIQQKQCLLQECVSTSDHHCLPPPEMLWKDQPQRRCTVKIWGTSNPMMPHWDNKGERRWTGPTCKKLIQMNVLERHKSCLICSYLGIKKMLSGR